jgi:phosphatidylserine/phosphatidylglycerophosphate/cardiolipin synthase-like enzyme
MNMAKFLTTSGINYLVEEIIKGAKERIVLVSPFLKLNDRIKELLGDGYRPDVDVRIVYGKKELEAPERQWLRSVPHVRTSFCQNLHAKCYLNETMCVITSLNLHLYSQQNNNEMGVMVKRSADHQMFSEITAEVDRLLRISELTHADRENLVLDLDQSPHVAESSPAYGKLTTAKLAKKLGVQTTQLFNKLIGCGYLELRDGDKPYITKAGKGVGGEFRMGKGPYFLWPADLHV